MKRPLAYTAAILLSAVPAVVGLWGNASFSQAVPVRVPAIAQLATASTPSPTSTGAPNTPSSTPTGIPSVDDHGGDRPTGTRTTEPGDNHGGSRGATAPGPTPSSVSSGHGGSGGSGGSGSGGSGGSSGSGGTDDASSHSSGGHGSDG